MESVIVALHVDPSGRVPSHCLVDIAGNLRSVLVGVNSDRCKDLLCFCGVDCALVKLGEVMVV